MAERILFAVQFSLHLKQKKKKIINCEIEMKKSNCIAINYWQNIILYTLPSSTKKKKKTKNKKET